MVVVVLVVLEDEEEEEVEEEMSRQDLMREVGRMWKEKKGDDEKE